MYGMFIIDAVFLLLERLSCIMHMKFMESVVVYQPRMGTFQPLFELPVRETLGGGGRKPT